MSYESRNKALDAAVLLGIRDPKEVLAAAEELHAFLVKDGDNTSDEDEDDDGEADDQ